MRPQICGAKAVADIIVTRGWWPPGRFLPVHKVGKVSGARGGVGACDVAGRGLTEPDAARLSGPPGAPPACGFVLHGPTPSADNRFCDRPVSDVCIIWNNRRLPR